MWKHGFHKEGDVVKVLPRYPLGMDAEFKIGMILDGYEIEEEPNERLAEWRWIVLVGGETITVKEHQVCGLVVDDEGNS